MRRRRGARAWTWACREHATGRGAVSSERRASAGLHLAPTNAQRRATAVVGLLPRARPLPLVSLLRLAPGRARAARVATARPRVHAGADRGATGGVRLRRAPRRRAGLPTLRRRHRSRGDRGGAAPGADPLVQDRKSTRLNSSHLVSSYA